MCGRARLPNDYVEIKIELPLSDLAPAPNWRPSWKIAQQATGNRVPLPFIQCSVQHGFAHLDAVGYDYVQHGFYPAVVITFDMLALVKKAPHVSGFVDQFALTGIRPAIEAGPTDEPLCPEV
jgi:hypothetical protein